MKFDRKSLLLYIVTDRTWLGNKSLAMQVEESIKAGATFVQLREKDISFDEFVSIAKEVKVVTDKHSIPFVINDNIDVALAVNSDGVHIGQDDEDLITARQKLGPNKIIGVSAGTIEQAKKAEKNGADYIGVGSIFTTSTKLDANQLSIEKLKDICNSVKIPVVAIGGISKDNIEKLKGSNIDGVAVVSAIFSQKDISKATTELRNLVEEVVE